MTYPDHAPPETWGRGLVAITEGDHFEIRVGRCRSVPHLRAAVRAEAERLNRPTRPDRIARLNQRIDDLTT